MRPAASGCGVTGCASAVVGLPIDPLRPGADRHPRRSIAAGGVGLCASRHLLRRLRLCTVPPGPRVRVLAPRGIVQPGPASPVPGWAPALVALVAALACSLRPACTASPRVSPGAVVPRVVAGRPVHCPALVRRVFWTRRVRWSVASPPRAALATRGGSRRLPRQPAATAAAWRRHSSAARACEPGTGSVAVCSPRTPRHGGRFGLPVP